MNFQEVLSGLVNSVDGTQMALLMGFDGIPVVEEKIEESQISLETIIECSALLKDSMRIVQSCDLGSFKQLVLVTGTGTILLQVVNPEYFVAMFLEKNGNVGKGKYCLQRLAPDFFEAL